MFLLSRSAFLKYFKRKFIVFLPVFILSFSAMAVTTESPIQIQLYSEMARSGMQDYVDVVALEDVVVKDIIINRGNCTLGIKQLGLFSEQFPAKLSYGETSTVVISGKTIIDSCKNILEVEVVTNKGNWMINP